MRLPKPTLTATAVTVAALALVVIAAATVFDAIGFELQRRELSRFTRPMDPSEGRVEVEVETTIIDTSQHFSGKGREPVVIDPPPGAWQIAVVTSYPLETQKSLASLDHSRHAAWTGVDAILSIIDPDVADRPNFGMAGLIMPRGPMELTVDTDEEWKVDLRRIMCPGDA